MDTEHIVKEWRGEFSKHPMFGENMSRQAIDDLWESGSAAYSDSSYSEIRDRIIEAVLSKGYLGKGDSLLDIGSGPGTFAVPFSGHCRSVLCVDSSAGMLRRIEEKGIANISVMKADCMTLDSGCRRDVAFCSLCPPMNTPEGIDLMCRLGEKCIYVSSANREKGLESEIWEALGEDYSYKGYDYDYPYRYLLSKGIDAKVEYFTQENETTETVAECLKRFASLVSRYRSVDEGCSAVIKRVVRGHSEDGIVRQRLSLRMGMLTWSTCTE